jgi:hypothetical protein
MSSKPVEHSFEGGVQIGNPILGDALVKVKKLEINSAPSGAEQDTGFDLPVKGIVLDVWLDVRTAEATGGTKTINIGLLASESGGDTDGFAVGIDVSTTGLKKAVATVTAGASETYFASTTRGALLTTFLAGSDVATDVGTNYETPHNLNGTARSVVYDADDSDWVEFRGDIYIAYMDLD